MNNNKLFDFVNTTNQYLQEMGIAERCEWSASVEGDLFLQLPCCGYKLCIEPNSKMGKGRHISLFFNDWTETQETRWMLDDMVA